MLALLLGLLCAGLACGSTDTAAKDETPSAPTVEQPEPEPTPEGPPDGGGAVCGRSDARGAEQVAQMFFVRCPETDAAALTAQYDIGGYLLFCARF